MRILRKEKLEPGLACEAAADAWYEDGGTALVMKLCQKPAVARVWPQFDARHAVVLCAGCYNSLAKVTGDAPWETC